METPPPVPSPTPPPMALAPAPAPEEFLSEDTKTLAMVFHLLGIFTGFVGPLILWLVKKDENNAFLDHHGRESLNFQLTVALVMVCLGALTFVLMLVVIGVLLIPVLIAIPVIALVFEIIAAIAAQRGEWYRYPLAFRFV